LALSVGRGAEILCYAKVFTIPPRVNRGFSFSWEIATTEVKGWITKIQFQRGRLTRKQMHHPPFHQIALWV
jgi:hypothetical protein